MIQILPRVKSFGQEFSSQIGQGVGQGIESGMKEQQKMADLQQENQSIFKDLGIKMPQGMIDPEMRKQYVTSQLQGKQKQEEREFERTFQLDKLKEQQKFDQEQQEKKYKYESDIQKEKYGFETEKDKNKPKGAAELKAEREELEHGEIKDRAQKSFNQMAKLMKKGNLGLGSGAKSAIIGGEIAKDVGKFTALSGALEAMLVDMVSRGTLSNTRFEYITKNLLPTASDRDKVIEGKLEGLAEILGLDASELGIKGKTKTSEDSVEMRDPEGNIYDIPKHLEQQFRAKFEKQPKAIGYK